MKLLSIRNFLQLFLLALLLNIVLVLRSEEVLQEITVEPGATLWSIANKYLKDPQRWPEIVRYNQLPTSDPTIALPGSKLKIPVLLIKDEYRTAKLIKMIPDVQYRRKGETEWLEAKENMTLKYEDSLRTLKAAEARVRFPSREVVQINENSYVVLKPEKIIQEVQLLEGRVRASKAKVILPGGTVVKPQGANSDYEAKVREDESQVVFVYKGEVDVTAQGKTVKVKEGFGTQVPKSAPPMQPVPLPNFADFNRELAFKEPETKIKVEPGKSTFNFVPPAMTNPRAGDKGKSKAVMAGDILSNYHVQLAKDAAFTQIVVEKTARIGTEFDVRKQSIPDGTYHMRVAFIDTLGVEGKYSTPNIVIKDTVPPALDAVRPENGQKIFGADAFCDVSGIARGATSVAINDEVVFLSSGGRFEKVLSLREGDNKIRIVARDGNGNQTIVERMVSYGRK